MTMQRIDKIISSQCPISRNEVKAMIKAGEIRINGNIVKKPDEKTDPEASVITINGNELSFKKHIYIMMNKPAGVLSASRDKFSKTVIDLLPAELRRTGLFPAGRLDKDTEGLIILTDDGDLAHKMLSPKNHVYKLYLAETDKQLSEDDEQLFRKGIKTETEIFLPAGMKITDEKTALVEICEGKFHQVKKMFAAAGANVVYLKRLRIGALFLDEKLAPGECRELSNSEKLQLLDSKCAFLAK